MTEDTMVNNGQSAEKSKSAKDKHPSEREWWEERSLVQKILIVAAAVIGFTALAFAFGWLVMLLWNWLMPELFGLKKIGYWQAWGLFLLCSILFKGWGAQHGQGNNSDRKRKRELRRHIKEATE
ncbi:MAG: TMEM208 family protein [Spirochaetes bacterium]|nr:TMEM208 family protein [Spirochaetota bacterium]